MKRWLRLGILVVVLGAIGVAMSLRPQPRKPAPPPDLPINFQLETGAPFDPTRLVFINWVNRTGQPCKISIEGDSAGTSGIWSALMSTEERGPSFSTAGPLKINAVIIEQGGQKMKKEVGVTLAVGSTHEVRAGPGDKVEVVAVGK